MRFNLLVALVLAIATASVAQQTTIRGIVTDPKKEPLVGASVVLMNITTDTATKQSIYTYTTLGSFTDTDGAFELDIDQTTGQAIEISYMGYTSERIILGNSTTYTIQLQPQTVELTTVVVTVPYSTANQRTYTGSTAVVQAESLENSGLSSAEYSLQATIPGIDISNPSGQPGSSGNISLRGIGSITAGSQPLIVIDGIVMYAGEQSQYGDEVSILSYINPQDIQSISILKDAAATSLYGSRASNGVIMITTKQGKKNSSSFSFSSSQGIGIAKFNNFSLLSANQYRELYAEGLANAGHDSEEIESELAQKNYATNWLKELYSPAWNQAYSAESAGGTEDVRYFASVLYKNEQGIAQGTDAKNFSTRINLDHSPTKYISYSVKFSPSWCNSKRADQPGILSSPITAAYLADPTRRVYKNEDYDFSNMFYNPLGLSHYNTNTSALMRTLGNAHIVIDLPYNLHWKSAAGVDALSNKEAILHHPYTPDGMMLNGIGQEYTTLMQVLSMQHVVNYNKAINQHNWQILAGMEAETATKNISSLSYSNFATSTVHSAASMQAIDGREYKESLLSYFSQVQYDYSSTYFISASVRTDGSSKFSPHNRWGTFGSVAGSWIITNSEFIPNSTQIPFAKLRISYGTSGNSNIENYAYMQLYEFGNNYNNAPGAVPLSIGNDNLSWEKNNTLNAGLDVDIYKRYKIIVDVYNRKTHDLLLEVPIPMLSGYSHQLQNVGAMRNSGIELQAEATVVQKKLLSYKTSIGFAHNNNKVIELYSPDKNDTIVQGTKIRTAGLPFHSFYLAEWAGVNSADGQPMWVDTEGNLTKDYNKARFVVAGNAQPIFTATWNNTLRYKAWELSCLWYANYGNAIFNQLQTELTSDGALWGKNQSHAALDRWQKPGDKAENPKFEYNNASLGNAFSTRYIEDGSYLRLKHITLSYTWNNLHNSEKPLLPYSHIKATLQASNPLVFSRFSGTDPETRTNGVYYFDYPKQSVYSLSIQIKF